MPRVAHFCSPQCPLPVSHQLPLQMPLSLTGTSGTQSLFRKERGQDLGLEAWKVFCVALCPSAILPVQEGCPESRVR